MLLQQAQLSLSPHIRYVAVEIDQTQYDSADPTNIQPSKEAIEIMLPTS